MCITYLNQWSDLPGGPHNYMGQFMQLEHAREQINMPKQSF